MDEKAIFKAKLRANVAKETAAGLAKCTDFECFSEAWFVFLHAAKGVYTILGLGAKSDAKTRQWFGGKDKERKSDPLLRYITEARNDDEHGLETGTNVVQSLLSLGVPGEGFSTRMVDQWGNVFEGNGGAAWTFQGIMPHEMPRLRALDNKPIQTAFMPAHVRLAAVKDREGKQYDPPRFHLGKPIERPSPQNVAQLMVDYLDKMLEEARAYVTPKPSVRF